MPNLRSTALLTIAICAGFSVYARAQHSLGPSDFRDAPGSRSLEQLQAAAPGDPAPSAPVNPAKPAAAVPPATTKNACNDWRPPSADYAPIDGPKGPIGYIKLANRNTHCVVTDNRGKLLRSAETGIEEIPLERTITNIAMSIHWGSGLPILGEAVVRYANTSGRDSIYELQGKDPSGEKLKAAEKKITAMCLDKEVLEQLVRRYMADGEKCGKN